MPSMRTLSDALPHPRQWSYFGKQLLHRQHHAGGNIQMMLGVFQHFRVPRCRSSASRQPGQNSKSFGDVCGEPTEKNERKAERLFLEDMIYLSQLHQAVAYQTETEHYRRWRNRTKPDGARIMGQTMCALYWQLNDIWQAPSWATIDYGLRWKAAHYFAKRFFAPVIVSPYMETPDRLAIFVVSDLQQPIRQAKLKLELLAWSNGFEPVFEEIIGVPKIPALAAKLVYWESFRHLMELALNRVSLETAPEDFLLKTRLLNEAGDDIAPENVLIPNKLHKVDPTLWGDIRVLDVALAKAHTFQVSLETTSLSLFVKLAADDMQGYFSDNYFAMTAKTKKVEFYPWSVNATLAQFKKQLTVQSLKDLYV